MGAVPGVRGVTVGTAVGRVCAGGRRNAQAPLPGKATPGDATGGRDRGTRPADAIQGQEATRTGRCSRQCYL